MSVHEHPGHPGRPGHTPDALRAALAVVTPERLPEMQRTKDQAFARAVEWHSLSPVRNWVPVWARDIEIARRPGLSTRHARARSDLEHEDAATAREALRELSAVLDEAMKAIRARAGPGSTPSARRRLPAPPHPPSSPRPSDPDVLRHWLTRAVTVSGSEDIFGGA